MTQSYNLSQLANNLTSAGQLDATDGLSGAVPAANGGTGQSAYTTGDILYASGATALAKLSDVATGNALISGGVGASPSWGKVGMATHVSGTLPVANGGTGLATIPANNVVLGNGTSAVQTVAPGTTGNVLTSNGTSWTSAAISVGSAATVFTSSGTFTIPSGITKVKMTVVGGGGPGSVQSSNQGGVGGSGGGAAIKWLSGLTPGNTLTVTVGGSGGTSSVASGTQTIATVSATGGADNYAPGGLGSNGDMNIRGNPGGLGSFAGSGGQGYGGGGGSSIFGGGGAAGTGGAGNGQPGGAYGGGGGGGGQSGGSGGAGASGVVLFEY